MALGKKCGSNVKRNDEGCGYGFVRRTTSFGNEKSADEGMGYGFVRRTTSFGRKRVVIDMDIDSILSTPTKKHCVDNSDFSSEKSLLEALPLDVLIHIVCGVDHDDLKNLFHVSKPIREATLLAKELHFEYKTPRKSTRPQYFALDDSEFSDTEAPNAPKQFRAPRSRLSRKKLEDISVALFSSPKGEKLPGGDLFMGMELEM